MLVAQTLNDNQKPVLGCYIRGSHWRFIVLDGLDFVFSPTLVADSEDIFDILRIVKALRYEIEFGSFAKP